MSIVAIDTSSAVAVTSYLEKAREWLATAVEQTGPEQIALAKAEIATAAEAAKQLGLSKEIRDDAAEMVRRAEYALAKSIRKGQEEGTVAVHGGARNSKTGTQSLKSPSEFASKQELSGAGHGQPGIYALAEAEPAELDAALDAAKAEGNLSRANVVRKVREATGTARQAQREDAEVLLNQVASLAAQAARAANKITPSQIDRVKPKADLWTVGLGESVETLTRLLTSLNEEK